jgi:diguanylate cyclase (GGDEF)-like protein
MLASLPANEQLQSRPRRCLLVAGNHFDQLFLALTRRLELRGVIFDGPEADPDIPSPVVIVDGRDGVVQAVQMIALLAGDKTAKNRAILALVDAANASRELPRLLEAGATHFLTAPFDDAVLSQAVLFAFAAVDKAQTALRLPSSAMLGWHARSPWVELNGDLNGLLAGDWKPRRMRTGELLARVDRADRPAFRAALRDLIEDGQQVELRIRLRDFADQIRHLDIAFWPEHFSSGTVEALTITVVDGHSSQASARQIDELDPLTGLPNAMSARDWLARHLAASAEDQQPLLLMMVSISRFDSINASYGRGTADIVLQQVARRLKRALANWQLERGESPTGTKPLLSRLGGAEYLVAVTGPLMAHAAMVCAQALAHTFDRQFRIGTQLIDLSCRIGLTMTHASESSADELIREATLALAEARAQPPNAIVVHSGATSSAEQLRTIVEVDLRSAIRREELSIVYQPQIDVSSGEIVGCEALVRWMHPVLGPVDPEQFIEVAEHAEFMSALDDLVLRKTLSEAASWSTFLKDRVKLSINVSGPQLLLPDFDIWFARALRPID